MPVPLSHESRGTSLSAYPAQPRGDWTVKIADQKYGLGRKWGPFRLSSDQKKAKAERVKQ